MKLDDFVNKAVGVPWVDGGRGWLGFDCWGCVRLCYLECLGIDLPSYGEISARDLVRVARAMGAAQDDGWATVSAPQDFDVVLMRSGRGGGGRTVHVGVMVDAHRMMHAELATGVTVVPITHFSVAGRILGYRRRCA